VSVQCDAAGGRERRHAIEAVVPIMFLIVGSVVSLVLLLEYRGWLGRVSGTEIGFYRVRFAIAFLVGAEGTR
jgi:hypothetical protein